MGIRNPHDILSQVIGWPFWFTVCTTRQKWFTGEHTL
jgi:hypothetical protein